MIGTLDVRVNAAKPNFPLSPLYAFVNSPSQLRVINVPKQIGSWRITTVQISVAYPDSASYSVAATLTGGCWSATIPASTATGTASAGLKITASGVKEDGETAVTGYVLGVGAVNVLDDDGTIVVGETTYAVHLRDSQPTTPRKGDICVIGGAWQIYNGTAWIALGSGGGDISHSDFSAVTAIGDRYQLGEVKAKVNEVLAILKGSAAIAIGAIAFALFGGGNAMADGLEIQKCAVSNLWADAEVVTNVSGAAGLAYRRELLPAVTGTVTKAYVEELGIEAGISAAVATNIATAVAATKRDLTDRVWTAGDEWSGSVITALTNAYGAVTWLIDISSAGGYAYFAKSSEIGIVAELWKDQWVRFSDKGEAYSASRGYCYTRMDTSGYVSREGRDLFALTSELAAATNGVATAAQVASATNALADSLSKVCWSSPGAWSIGYSFDLSPVLDEGFTLTTNANYQVYSNYTIVASTRMAANCYPISLDEFATTAISVTNWVCQTAGGSFSNSTLIANADGMYVVRGDASDGTFETQHIPITSYTISTNDYSDYVTDGNAYRLAVQDAASATLAAATPNVSGGLTNGWITLTHYLSGTAAGSSAPFAISPHVLIYAHHYGGWSSSPQFSDGSTTVTMNVTNFVLLTDWMNARHETTNGVYTADTRIAFCDDTAAVPNGCLPYFMRDTVRSEIFGANLESVSGWAAVPGFAYAVPVVFDAINPWFEGALRWGIMSGNEVFSSGYKNARLDIRNRLTAMGDQYDCPYGASGKPIFIVYGGKKVVLSHFRSFQDGPDYSRLFEILAAVAASRGETLKECTK